MNVIIFFSFILSVLCSVAVVLIYFYFLSIFKRFKSRIDEIENYRQYE